VASAAVHICSGASPTESPPMAKPGNGRSRSSAACAARRSSSRPPWTMPKRAWSGRVCAARQRSAQRVVRRTAASTSGRGAVAGGHSSKAMAMSDPSASWMAIERSGVRTRVDPSIWDWNLTPSSLTLRSVARLKTW